MQMSLMKKSISVILISLLGTCVSSCKKNDSVLPSCAPLTIAASAGEVAILKTYIDSNQIVATQDSRGFFYSIDFPTNTDTTHPTTCSDVSVTYTGTFLNGAVFDSTGANSPVSLNLSGTIVGWQEAVPLMRANAGMTLYLPPSLAYGASGYSSIPGNSYLIFKIKLLAFN
jgi:FKBP-type peptidyl-prolyl cis-trans isomerase FkpA